ncbi:hypothetical protein GCM10010452_23830 [Crossiella cryophila]
MQAPWVHWQVNLEQSGVRVQASRVITLVIDSGWAWPLAAAGVLTLASRSKASIGYFTFPSVLRSVDRMTFLARMSRAHFGP